jgi:hypothetical protein
MLYAIHRYKWINKGWKLEKRIEYFEERWAYFAGFGFTFTVITFFVDQFLSAGVFALFFPLVSFILFAFIYFFFFDTFLTIYTI